ncbi:MAG: SDR family NAD(P)-dependent oxidoreductase [Gammaproteobacteria bacterium]|nr:SDR family NAD(P)-dependent oxidoreductase [Gammaproteobacteria bacterium]
MLEESKYDQSGQYIPPSESSPQNENITTHQNHSRMAFIFAGEGSQYRGMAESLYKANEFFRLQVDKCHSLFTKKLQCKDPLFSDAYPLVSLFTLEYALAQLWMHWGVTPSFVMGHSDGEYAAAVISGILTLENAVDLIAMREDILQRLPSQGNMCALSISKEELELLLSKMTPQTDLPVIAAWNSPDHLVVSGKKDKLNELMNLAAQAGIKYTWLSINHPFHSPLLDAAGDAFLSQTNKMLITYSKPKIPYVSGMSGEFLNTIESNTYWQQQMCQTVQFQKGLETLANQSCSIYLEMSPRATLTSAIGRTLGPLPIILGSLDEHKDPSDTLLGALKTLQNQQTHINYEVLPDHLQRVLIKQKRTLEKNRRKKQDIKTPTQTFYYEPIAVIGCSCRFPGGVNTPDDLWELLRDKRHGITEVDPERWDKKTLQSLDVLPPLRGGFVDDVDKFDAGFFGIRESEALLIDPQQRLLTEATWEALENAGIVPGSLHGQPDKPVSICMGISGHDYGDRLGMVGEFNAMQPVGNVASAAPGRLAMHLGVEGPTFAIDSACSSSFVAIHAAIQNLQTYHADLGIAGAANLMLTPDLNSNLVRANMLAPDASCKVFDKKANGYVRAEGIGVVILKRLSDAIKDGDLIHGVIRASNISQDGRRSHMSMPNADAQEHLLRRTLSDAGLKPGDIDYFEAHGTGTPLGDPTETRAIAAVYGGNHAHELKIGSIKSNIGHAETAAGMAGLLKVLLSLKNNAIPANINFNTINPDVARNLNAIPCSVVTNPFPWERGRQGGRPRVAALSAFGFTGTITHMIVEEPPLPAPRQEMKRSLHPVTLSAKDKESLQKMVTRFKDFTIKHPDLSCADMAYTTNIGREHFTYRAVINAHNIAEFQEKISKEQYIQGNGISDQPVCFLFTGQGSQYSGMAKNLYETNEIFRKELSHCVKQFNQLINDDTDLLAIIFSKEDSRINQTRYTQMALFSIEYALSRMWNAWGIYPDLMAGHSLGEFVAAVLAQVVSIDDAIKLVYHRAKLMQALQTDNGEMWAIHADITEIQQRITQYNEVNADQPLDVAAYNTNTQTVISGKDSICGAFLATLPAEIKKTKLNVSHAFHSRLMQPMLEEYRKIAESVVYHSPIIPIYSTLLGRELAAHEMNAEYWCKHIVQPVQFYQALRELLKTDCKLFIEVGPRPILSGFGRQCVNDGAQQWLCSLNPREDNWHTLLQTLATLYVSGCDIDWDAFNDGYDLRKCELPSYPFQRKRCWPISLDAGYTLKKDDHPLLGKRIPVATTESGRLFVYEACINRRNPGFMLDHQLYGLPVVAGAAYLSAIHAAMTDLFPDREALLSHVEFRQPVILRNADSITLQTVIKRMDDTDEITFSIYSADDVSGHEDVKWTQHVEGNVTLKNKNPLRVATDVIPLLQDPSAKASLVFSSTDIYRYADSLELQLGRQFQWIETVYKGSGWLLGKLRKPVGDEKNYLLHPGLFDSCFQVCLGIFLAENSRKLSIPLQCDDFSYQTLNDTPDWVMIEHDPKAKASDDTIQLSLRLLREDGSVLGEMKSLILKSAPKNSLFSGIQANSPAYKWLYRPEWQHKSAGETKSDFLDEEKGSWLLFDDGTELATKTVDELKRRHPTDGIETINGADVADSIDVYTELLADFCEKDPKGIVYFVPETSATVFSDSNVKKLFYLAKAAAGIPWKHVPKIWVITRQAVTGQAMIDTSFPATSLNIGASTVTGFVKSISIEYPQFKITQLDISSELSLEKSISVIDREIHQPDTEQQIVITPTQRLVPRLTRYKLNASSAQILALPQSEAYRLEKDSVNTTGMDIPVKLVSIPVNTTLQQGEVLVNVKATSLNFRDLLNAIGQYPVKDGDPGHIGGDLSGIIAEVGPGVTNFKVGDSVLGLSSNGCLASQVVVHQNQMILKPHHWSFEEAAGIPTVYLTVHQCLMAVTRLKKGDKILIHSATGGVGLAAIAIAKHIGAEIFATAGSPEKREYLRKMGIQHIMNSRDPKDYRDAILKITSGQGVDSVLNFLTGPGFIQASLDALRQGGSFVEIGKRDIWEKAEMTAKRPDVDYQIVALDKCDSEVIAESFRELSPLFDAECLPPMPHVTYPIESVVPAFRKMMKAEHMGKIIVRVTPPYKIEKKATYLVTGGLGGIGRSVCEWLVSQGVECIVLVGRKPPTEADLRKLDTLSNDDTKILAMSADVSDDNSVNHLIHQISETLPPLKGIYHAAGVLRDGAINNLVWDDFKDVFAPKVQGTLNLHHVTEKQNISLDHFVLFSSIVSVNGSPGQANYVAANTFLDTFAAWRRQQGKCAVSINWGAWANVGMAAEKISSQVLQQIGMTAMQPQQAMEAFSAALTSNAGQLVIADVDWSVMLQKNPHLKNNLERLANSAPVRQTRVVSWMNRLKQLPTPEQQEEMLQEMVLETLSAHAQASDRTEIGLDDSFNDLGIDSLETATLSNNLRNKLGNCISLTPHDFAHHSTAAALARLLFNRLNTIQFFRAEEGGTHEEDVWVALPSQTRMWMDEVLYGNDIRNTHQILLSFKGILNANALQKSAAYVMKHFYLLQSTFKRTVSGVLTLQSNADAAPDFKVVTLDASELSPYINSEQTKSFPQQQPLIRFRLCLTDDTSHLMVEAHRSVFDRSSWPALIAALSQCYEAALNNKPMTLDSFPNQYRNLYARFKNGRTESGKNLSFWKNYLDGFVFSDYFSVDKNRAHHRGYQTTEVNMSKNNDDSSLLSTADFDCETIGLSALLLLLSQVSGRKDHIVMLTERMGVFKDAQNTIGQFETCLPFRHQVDVQLTLIQFLQQVKTGRKNVLSYNDNTIADIISASGIHQDIDYQGLMQIGFEYIRCRNTEFGGIMGELIPDHEHEGHQYGFLFRVFEKDNGFALQVSYNQNHYAKSDVTRLTASWLKIMTDMLKNPEKTLKEISGITDALASRPTLVHRGYEVDLLAMTLALKTYDAVSVQSVDFELTKEANSRLLASVNIGQAYDLTIGQLHDLSVKWLASELPGNVVNDVSASLSPLVTQFGNVILKKWLETDGRKGIKLAVSTVSDAFFHLANYQLKNTLGSEKATEIIQFMKSRYKLWRLRGKNTELILRFISRITDSIQETYHKKLASNLLRHLSAAGIPNCILPDKILITNGLGIFHEHEAPSSEATNINHDSLKLEQAYISQEAVLEQKISGLVSWFLKRQVSPHENIFNINGISPEEFIFGLLSELSSVSDAPLDMNTLLLHPTISDLTDYLSQHPSSRNMIASPNDAIFPVVQCDQPKTPLFLIHPATGLAHAYQALKKFMGDEIVYGINNPRINDPVSHYSSVEEMAADYIKMMQAIQPKGPYRIGGWSYGGNVAFEMAQQLRAMGEPVEIVVMLDTFNLSAYTDKVSAEEFVKLAEIQALAGSDLFVRREMINNIILNMSYKPKPYAGRVALFHCHIAVEPFNVLQNDLYNGWSGLVTPNIQLYSLNCNHYELFFKNNAEITAYKLKELMNSGIDHDAVLQKTDLSLTERYALFAARNNDAPLLSVLLNETISPKAVDFSGRNILHWLALHHNEALMDKVLEQSNPPCHVRDHSGLTPYDLAAGNESMQAKLLAASLTHDTSNDAQQHRNGLGILSMFTSPFNRFRNRSEKQEEVHMSSSNP